MLLCFTAGRMSQDEVVEEEVLVMLELPEYSGVNLFQTGGTLELRVRMVVVMMLCRGARCICRSCKKEVVRGRWTRAVEACSGEVEDGAQMIIRRLTMHSSPRIPIHASWLSVVRTPHHSCARRTHAQGLLGEAPELTAHGGRTFVGQIEEPLGTTLVIDDSKALGVCVFVCVWECVCVASRRPTHSSWSGWVRRRFGGGMNGDGDVLIV
jgi:hypothetical protein